MGKKKFIEQQSSINQSFWGDSYNSHSGLSNQQRNSPKKPITFEKIMGSIGAALKDIKDSKK